MTERKRRLRTGATLAILAVLALVALWCDINAGYRSISLGGAGTDPFRHGESEPHLYPGEPAPAPGAHLASGGRGAVPFRVSSAGRLPQRHGRPGRARHQRRRRAARGRLHRLRARGDLSPRRWPCRCSPSRARRRWPSSAGGCRWCAAPPARAGCCSSASLWPRGSPARRRCSCCACPTATTPSCRTGSPAASGAPAGRMWHMLAVGLALLTAGAFYASPHAERAGARARQRPRASA